jgi:diguanylate cyclase (GGDEF)-like protein
MQNSEHAGGHPTVLLASDQEASSRSLESILVPNGYTVIKADTGAQALERARNAQPDVIILDAILPDQGALPVCRRLRTDPHLTPHIPIVVVSRDHATRRERIDALRAGAWELLGQPLNAEHLVLKLETFARAKIEADRAREHGLIDQTTGIYNLRGLARRARELSAQASRLNATLACVVFAPDFGAEHATAGAGEDAIEAAVAQVATAFRAAGRASDAIGRMGPTEFAVLACGTNAAGSVRLAERLARAVDELAGDDAGPQWGAAPPFRLRAGYYVVSDSRGRRSDPTETLLRAATALRLSRSEPGGSWLRAFPDPAEPSATP